LSGSRSDNPGPPRLRQPPNRGALDRLRPEIQTLDWEAPLWRLQKDPGPAHRRYPGPRYRFDAPSGRYATVYANDSWLGVFGEVFVDRGRRIGRAERGLHLVRITTVRSLPLVDLRSNATLSAFDLDARISTGEDYETCQQWALALYEAYPEICGLRYAPRKAGEEFSNVALFAERCADALDYSSQGRLEELEDVVLAASREYKLHPAFLT
jgi:hypothetical protein